MATNQRYQTIFAAPQNRFDPDSPVWVSRYQLSRDLTSGRRLLQARLVNVSDKRIRQVFLRVRCLDPEGRQLAMLEMVPMPGVLALPGRIFGDDKIVELTAAAAQAEVYAQRVLFTDGTAWNETGSGNYIAFAAPVPVRAGDEAYQQLKDRAAAGGVRNSYYFRMQKGLWLCTCGQPNGVGSLRCAHCGADRLWLEQNMDPEAAPAPTPEPEPAPAREPAPAVLPVMQIIPPPSRPSPKVELPYPQPITPPVRRPAYVPEPEPETPERHPGRTAAIILLILALLAVGGWCAYRFLLPATTYRKAEQALQSGDLNKAEEIFEELGEYRDSPEQVLRVKLRRIRERMAQGEFSQAVELLQEFEGTPEYDEYLPDCLYSLGVLAYNDGDVETAWEYAEQLAQRYPTYSRLPELRNACCYSFGNEAVSEASGEPEPTERILLYERAIYEFTQAEGYSDSAERILECRYRIAIEQMNMDELSAAIDSFTALGGYKSSAEYRADCMYRYAWQHLENTDDTTMEYLEELADDGYDGAQELLDRYTGEAFSFHITLGPNDNHAEVVEVGNLADIYIFYRVESTDEEGAVLVLARYTLPDGRQGRGLLNNDRSAAGSKSWASLFPTDCAVSGEVTLELFDSARGELEPLSTVKFRYNYQAPAAPED